MREAWHIVDVYCLLCVLRSVISAAEYRNDATLLAISAAALVVVLFLSWATYKGSRIASRILSLYIIANAVSAAWRELGHPQVSTVFSVYSFMLFLYLVIGAIKLWRIKELPTRFTDPPVEA